MDAAREIAGALLRQLGEERYQWWFAHGLEIDAESDQVTVSTSSNFMLQRVRTRLLSHLRDAAREVYGRTVTVRLQSRDAQPEAESAATADSDASQVQSIASVLALKDQQDEPAPRKRRTRSQSSRGAASRSERHDEPTTLPVNQALSVNKASAAAESGVPSSTRGKRTPNNRAQNNSQQRTQNQNEQRLFAREDASESTTNPQRGPQSVAAGASLRNFAVGPCNHLAQMAATSVCDQPGSISPLFFWGPPGTGKTHLLGAIRNELRHRHRLRRVVLLTAEQFTNDFTAAVRGGGLPSFRRRYRDVDALLLDDVQFVRGKNATVRELLYTVESLLRGRCQLAFTADRPPTELKDITDELAGRLASGIVCPLRPLDTATRRQVLGGLAELREAPFDEAVLDRLAEELSGDGRILSGAVHHLRVLGQMLGRPATWEELAESAPDLIAAGRPAVNLNDIQKAVCNMFGLPTGALRSRGQQRAVSQPRMLAMYLARQYTRAPYSEIGEYFGNRSHSTVIAAHKRVEDWLAESKPVRKGGQMLPPRQAIEAIENLLRTG